VNLAGVVSGKALYEKKFTVQEAQAALADGQRSTVNGQRSTQCS
jgi:hypothetical protein